MELDTLYSCGSNGYNEALFSDTFNFFNENFDDISLYHNFLTNDVNFLPDLNFLPDSEPLSLNSNIQHLEPLNDIPDSDIPTFELLNDISNPFNYQYNLAVGDSFDDWLSVDAFMHQYCFERGFSYQIFRSDKDPKDPTIIRRKLFRCSSSGVYKARKVVDHTIHRLRGTVKTDCEWHCNFTFPKTINQIRCTLLKGTHNHETNPTQVPNVIARYRRFSKEMIQDLNFFMDCKVAPITQLEILKKKYPEHVFHKRDVYNAIYSLLKSNKNEKFDTTSMLDILFEKVSQDPRWKVYIRHAGNEHRLSGIFWMSPVQQELYQRFSDVVLNDNTCKTNKYNMYLSVFMVKDNYGRFRNIANALVEDEMSSTYTWILQCLLKATGITPKSFWTDSEPGLINAVSQVFPTTPHFYCLFHIWQNVIKHLKAKLGSNFNHFAKAFYACRNALCVEIFEKRWKLMIENFPECENYMARLYTNRISWAKAYLPLQFNAGIQSTQSVESFNNIIKKSLNGASTLCDVETAIDKRQEEEIRYCQLSNIKTQYTTIGLPHFSSQFFSSIDKVFTEFLSPLILSWQRFQVSQSFTYEGQLVSYLSEVRGTII